MIDDDLHAAEMARTGFWGRRGAGCLVMAASTGRILVPRRSEYVLEPGTWGTWGGAVDEGEDPAAAAVREAVEEAGLPCEPLEVIPLMVFRDEGTGFAYHNFLTVVEDEFEAVLGWETAEAAWFRFGEWPSPLHFGLSSLLADGDSAKAIDEACARDRRHSPLA